MDGTLPKFYFLKLQGRGGLQSHTRAGIPLDGGGFFGPYSFIILKSSYQDLSNEESNIFLSSLELGF